MARLSLKNITKTYDGKITAVAGFNLDVADGELMVIVGPSGSGKTTILRIIAGLEESDSGEISIANERVNDVPPRKRDVAMVFQNYALYPHMTVLGNISFPLRMQRLSRRQIRKRVDETAGLLNIANLLDRKPATLSGGQRQRVALARAIVREPRVFLFDEPLSNLDAQLRDTVRAELKALHRRLNATSVYVTHDQAEAMTLGDRICVIHNGRIRQLGPPAEVYERPLNRFTAAFFGAPPMNFFRGRLTSENRTLAFSFEGARLVLPDRLKEKLDRHHNKELILGVRPHALSLRPFDAAPDSTLSATVNMLEPMGVRTDVCLTADGGTRFTASLGPHVDIDAGDRLKIYLDTQQILIFEADPEGKTLTLPE